MKALGSGIENRAQKKTRKSDFGHFGRKAF
jgi:hypothetical protein